MERARQSRASQRGSPGGPAVGHGAPGLGQGQYSAAAGGAQRGAGTWQRSLHTGKQIALLPGAPTRYPLGMDHDDIAPRPAPAGWLETLERSEADLEAGRTVPLEPVLARMRDSIKRMEARQAGQDADAAQQE